MLAGKGLTFRGNQGVTVICVPNNVQCVSPPCQPLYTALHGCEQHSHAKQY
ncbi:unnamed protein product, partial [Staurois parvus]